MINTNQKLLKIKKSLKINFQRNPIKMIGKVVLFCYIILLVIFSNNNLMNSPIDSENEDNGSNFLESDESLNNFLNDKIPNSSDGYNSSIPQPNLTYVQLDRWTFNLSVSWEPFYNQSLLTLYWGQNAIMGGYDSYEDYTYISLNSTQSEHHQEITINNRSYGNAFYYVKAQLRFSYSEEISPTHTVFHHNFGKSRGILVVMERLENEFPLYESWSSSRSVQLVWACGPSTCVSQSSHTMKLIFSISDINETHFEITIQPSGFSSVNYTFSFGNITHESLTGSNIFILTGDPFKSSFEWNISGTYTYEYCSAPGGIECWATDYRTEIKEWSGNNLIEQPIVELESEFPTEIVAGIAPPIVILGVTALIIKNKK